MNNAPMKPGMRQRLSRPNMNFRPVNRKVQPKTASLAQRKTIDAGRRFVGKYTAADLVSGNGAKARRAVSKTGVEAGATSNNIPNVARTDKVVGNTNTQKNTEKIDNTNTEMRPDFRPEFAREKKQSGEF